LGMTHQAPCAGRCQQVGGGAGVRAPVMDRWLRLRTGTSGHIGRYHNPSSSPQRQIERSYHTEFPGTPLSPLGLDDIITGSDRMLTGRPYRHIWVGHRAMLGGPYCRIWAALDAAFLPLCGSVDGA
jgi:hypothetical protein